MELAWNDLTGLGILRTLVWIVPAGFMANYLYRLADVERNHELYTGESDVIASGRLNRLARESLFARAAIERNRKPWLVREVSRPRDRS